MIFLAALVAPCVMLRLAASVVSRWCSLGGRAGGREHGLGQLVTVYPLPGSPGAVSAADGSVWVTDTVGATVTSAHVASVTIPGQEHP